MSPTEVHTDVDTGAMKRGGYPEPEPDATKSRCLGYQNFNARLTELKVDYFYHLGISSDDNLKEDFGDVRLVCLHGSGDRALAFGRKVAAAFGRKEDEVKPIGKTERGMLCKVGPVISISHGMGMPSMSIFLHEVCKLLKYAGCLGEVEFIRLGTSGGIGLEPGTVVITSEAFDGTFEPGWEQIALGEKKRWPAVADIGLSARILSCAKGDHCAAGAGGIGDKKGKDIKAIIAASMGTDDFYEGQGRLDGCFSTWYNEDDKIKYLERAHEKGIRNIEMECSCLLALFQRLGRPCTVVCPTLLDRLKGDQITTPPEGLAGFVDESHMLVLRYMKAKFGEKFD